MKLINADYLNLTIDGALKEETNGSNAYRQLQMKLLAGFAHTVLNEAPTVEAIPTEQLLSILPKYDDYIHTKTYPYNETMEDIYSKGHEEGWNACLKAIKEELEEWKKENESN